jgi:hypothetical protein
MPRFLADLELQIAAEKKIAKPRVMAALQNAELPDGIMVLKVDDPIENNNLLFHKLLVPVSIVTSEKINKSKLLNDIKNSIHDSNIIIININILGEVHDG